jgi:hypothetical protein
MLLADERRDGLAGERSGEAAAGHCDHGLGFAVVGRRRHPRRHRGRRCSAGNGNRHGGRRVALVDGHDDHGAVALVGREKNILGNISRYVHPRVARSYEFAVIHKRVVAFGIGFPALFETVPRRLIFV